MSRALLPEFSGKDWSTVRVGKCTRLTDEEAARLAYRYWPSSEAARTRGLPPTKMGDSNVPVSGVKARMELLNAGLLADKLKNSRCHKGSQTRSPAVTVDSCSGPSPFALIVQLCRTRLLA